MQLMTIITGNNTSKGTYKEKVNYHEACNIKSALLSSGYKNVSEKWSFKHENGNTAIYNIGDGEIVLEIKA